MPTVVKNSMLFLYADDNKLFSKFANPSSGDLQSDTERWSIQFNTTKCKILHLEKANPHAS